MSQIQTFSPTTMVHHNHTDSISSSSSSVSSISSSGLKVSTPPSTPPPQISRKCGRDMLDVSNTCQASEKSSVEEELVV